MLTFAYFDGFGRGAQMKVQAEPGNIVRGGARIDPRWVGTGWTVYNNKGKPVRQFEPYFSATHAFEFNARPGVSCTLFYDPLERVVATLKPDHSWEKVVFDPWQTTSHDAHDTVHIVDPRNDPDVGPFFQRLPQAEWYPTWHALRTDPSHAVAFRRTIS